LSNFDYPNTSSSPSHYFRIKPIAFEYDRIKRFATIKVEFIYFVNYSIILDPILARRKNSGTCGSSIGLTLLLACSVKVISIHVITGK
jgi:hypothetical protein